MIVGRFAVSGGLVGSAGSGFADISGGAAAVSGGGVSSAPGDFGLTAGWGFGNTPGLGLGARTGGFFTSVLLLSAFRRLGWLSHSCELSRGTRFSFTPNGFAATSSDWLGFVTEL